MMTHYVWLALICWRVLKTSKSYEKQFFWVNFTQKWDLRCRFCSIVNQLPAIRSWRSDFGMSVFLWIYKANIGLILNSFSSWKTISFCSKVFCKENLWFFENLLSLKNLKNYGESCNVRVFIKLVCEPAEFIKNHENRISQICMTHVRLGFRSRRCFRCTEVILL